MTEPIKPIANIPDLSSQLPRKKPGFVDVAKSVVNEMTSDATVRQKVEHTVQAVAYVLGASTNFEEMLAAQKLREELAAETAAAKAAKAYGKSAEGRDI